MKLIAFYSCLVLHLSILAQNQKINGIGFVSSQDSINETHVKPLINVNANYIAVNPFGFVRGLNVPKVNYNSNYQWFGETSEGIKQYAYQFKKNGVKIMLKPQIWVMQGSYTGHIKMKTEKDWVKFEASYQAFILHFAKIATDIDADIFCIGVELEQFTIQRLAFWRKLIVEIKKVYKGKLTYAANWDEYKRVLFWNQLDFIGIDAYFPLSNLKTPSVNELEKGWKTHKALIKKAHLYYKKPILFTEFGYRSIDFAAKEPWDSSVSKLKQTNLIIQKNALQAIYNQFWNEKWFAGGFLWKWFPEHHKSGGVKNNRFTPQNKPAELIIKKMYAN